HRKFSLTDPRLRTPARVFQTGPDTPGLSATASASLRRLSPGFHLIRLLGYYPGAAPDSANKATAGKSFFAGFLGKSLFSRLAMIEKEIERSVSKKQGRMGNQNDLFHLFYQAGC